ncbi:MAG: tetratricopeptide repeat protein [Spirochaetes bacterium]|nr:tetratricopeptide repeat protein [Spirochaetota bacterium]
MKKSSPFLLILVCVLIVMASSHALFSDEDAEDRARHKKAIELGESDRVDEALTIFDKAVEYRKRAMAIAYHNKGYALEKKGDLPQAIKNYEEAWKLNPKQILTGERLCYSHYKTENYERTIQVGEAVLKADPANKQVPPWLEDAYKKRGGKKQEVPEKPQVFYMTLDGMVRMGSYYGNKSLYWGIYHTSHHGFRYVPDDGLITSAPYTLFMRITPIPLIQIDATLENPWLGALTPPGLVVLSEKAEILFNIKNIKLGAGVMLNQYDTSRAFYRRYRLNDVKVGLIVGYRKDKVDTTITWYPRMLIMDPRSSSGKSFDVGSLRIDYGYQMYPDVKIHAIFNFRDYYVFCHSNDWRVFYMSFMRYYRGIASYWGVYDMGLGLTFGNLVKHDDGSELLSLTVEWLERFYLENLNNTHPYTLAPNGQGWFGLDVYRFTKGKPFPGFKALSQVISLRLNESFTRNFFMYQKFIAEVADQDSEHHEFNIQIGMGIKF